MQDESYFSSTIAPRFQKFTHESLSPRMVGFMLSKMWVYAVFFNPALAMPLLQESGFLGLGTLSRAALILTFLAGAFTAHGWLERMGRAPGCYIPAALSAVGVLAIPLGLMGWLPLWPAALVAAVGTGVGSGLLALEWGFAYGRTPLLWWRRKRPSPSASPLSRCPFSP